jgi:hypothetical protein
MKRGFINRTVFYCLLLASPLAAGSQVEGSFDTLVGQAEVIFAGHIKSVEPPNESHSTYVITAVVTDGIRGVRTGTDFQWNEWAGSWPLRGQRYRAGQNLILLMYKPDKNGISSVMGGSLGRFEVTASNTVKLSDLQRRALSRSLRLSVPQMTDPRPVPVLYADFTRALRERAMQPSLY